MKPYPHPARYFRCVDCTDFVAVPGGRCARHRIEERGPGPVEAWLYRFGVRVMESFDRLKWLPKTCAIILAVGLIFLIVRMGFGAVVVHKKVAEWRQSNGD